MTEKQSSDTKPKVGRPEVFTKELGDVVCERLSLGESMRSIARDPDMPGITTLFKWIRTDDEFAAQYDRAKEESADAIYDEIQEIADDGTNDWVEQHGDDAAKAAYKLNGESIQRSRLRVDTRKWMASKMKPKRYGDRQIIDQTTTTVAIDDLSKVADFLREHGIDPSTL